MSFSIFIATGLAAGVLAGLFGVGGGLIIVPCLVFLLGFSQMAATGTSLVALLLPVGIGGVYAFYQAGKIGGDHIKAGLLISLGMFLGSYFGSRIALSFPDYMLKRAFCVFLVIVAVRMWMMTTSK
jgi:uncharacterized membrane protein YfcA